MTDKKETQLFSTDERSDPLTDSQDLMDSYEAERRELKGLLARWKVPEPPALLDERVTQAYRQQMSLTPHTSEVMKMKRCSTCQEEFADRFSFCPVDGTPLSGAVAEANVIVSEGFDEETTLSSNHV